ncbi:MAG: putative bifunctional diguanylate cyclase/phosphodiesterase [Lachnotalea sp.]
MEKTDKKSVDLQIIIRILILEIIFILALYNIFIVMKQDRLTHNTQNCTIMVMLFTLASIGVIIYLEIKRRKLRKIEHVNDNSGKLEYLSFHDSLTGLPNRAYFDKMIPVKMSEAQLDNTKVSVVFVGLDNFKKLNDTLGHVTGDAIIKEVAKRLFSNTQQNIETVRFGGDEFIVVSSGHKDIFEISHSVNNIKQVFKNGFDINNKKIHVTASLGYAVYPDQAQESKMLLQYADIAMYHAKELGKNKVLMFKPDMSNNMQNRMLLEQKIVECIKNDGFEMYYQPQYDFFKNQFRGFEALIRWNDEELGWISPAIFIPIAEESGDIIELGEWVLREVCSTWVSWKKKYGHVGIISVNVSAVQLTKPDFVELVDRIIKEYKIIPNELELEITESVFIHDIESIIITLNKLKAIGVSLSLDDFGTGYSSLTYLKDLPMDTLKIDKSFISNITENNRQAEITDALIELVHKLDMETIAEGVETKEQYDFLRYMKCDNIQGYFTGKPMNEQSAAELIKNKCYA